MQILGDAAVIDGRQRIRKVDGELNLPTVQRYANIASAIRRGLPQVRGYPPNTQPVCLVGSGASLDATLPELRACAAAGYPLIAMNGSYAWLLAHDLTPNALVLLDGRLFNERFITQRVPGCRYLLASQCHPGVFDKVAGWPEVYLWHCLTGSDAAEKALLDDYYLKAWQPVSGGCTVALRAIVLLRIMGFQAMELFGVDSCYLDGRGHALEQPENDGDESTVIYCGDRSFRCNAWHVSQALELMDLIATNGEHFALEIHGAGLLAHWIRAEALTDATADIRAQVEGA
jgi:hypothetical protein